MASSFTSCYLLFTLLLFSLPLLLTLCRLSQERMALAPISKSCNKAGRQAGSLERKEKRRGQGGGKDADESVREMGEAGKTVSPLAWPSSSGPSRATKAETTPHSSSFASRLSPPLVTRSEHSTRVRGFGSSLTWPARMETTGPAGAGAGAGARAETQNRIVSSSPLVVEARPYVAASSARVTQLASGTRAAGTQLKEEGAKEEERGVSRPLVSEKEQRVSLKSRQERLALALAKEVLSSAKSLKSPESDRRP
ncbi:hypothetical protein GUITHDRAFT_147193 [Guillardia theta CCMP2712]|uniref:Uncharacterized protein n=1 Tax=Guillardia theta (strain CCMP2712) TaxID=905079 RepID=L1IEZ5_GUITC|nr:hypothetical protein GUITHDRAFT_147193 [Guillardia theta CCMP2712]EKX34494.1 hypothetical protein GUITHDRAFT_147193 [Guillardia theta CCMP2712]|eukprot:XP_005821474.1 hypothetical protein GUITHDRAFT_147193 [Guillardia theta CCMP2712]